MPLVVGWNKNQRRNAQSQAVLLSDFMRTCFMLSHCACINEVYRALLRHWPAATFFGLGYIVCLQCIHWLPPRVRAVVSAAGVCLVYFLGCSLKLFLRNPKTLTDIVLSDFVLLPLNWIWAICPRTHNFVLFVGVHNRLIRVVFSTKRFAKHITPRICSFIFSPHRLPPTLIQTSVYVYSHL